MPGERLALALGAIAGVLASLLAAACRAQAAGWCRSPRWPGWWWAWFGAGVRDARGAREFAGAHRAAHLAHRLRGDHLRPVFAGSLVRVARRCRSGLTLVGRAGPVLSAAPVYPRNGHDASTYDVPGGGVYYVRAGLRF